MVDVIGRAKVIITGDVDPRSIDQSGSKIGSRLKVGAAVGAAALGTLAVAASHAVHAFEEGEASSRKLANVLGNMGKSGATESVEKLASTLQRQTGVSDDTIRSGQTLLATFSEIAKSAGEVGGNFERATRAAVDMAAAGFGSVESASIQLGKALQDPIKGVTALNRSGVTFTEDQKKLIKSFVESGDAAKAQALILKEVEKQVKGTGKASATESAKVKQAFGEIEQSAGQAIAALAGEGKGKKSLSGELFKVSDALSELAESKDWKTLGKNLRGTAKDTGTVADALFDAGREAKKLTDKIPGLSEALGDLAVGPFWGSIDRLADLADAARKAWGWLKKVHEAVITGPDVPDAPDIAPPQSSRASGGPARGLTLVGENGPELARFGSGGYVYNNSQTRDIMSKASGAEFNLTQVFNSPGSASQGRADADWWMKHGTRFGAATSAGAT